MRPIAREKDPEKQKEVFRAVNQEMIQPHAKRIEQHLNQKDSGFLVGNAVRKVHFTNQKIPIDLLKYYCNFQTGDMG